MKQEKKTLWYAGGVVLFLLIVLGWFIWNSSQQHAFTPDQLGTRVVRPPKPNKPSCTDSDKGLNYSKKGTVQYKDTNRKTSTYSDVCLDAKKLTEYYCDKVALTVGSYTYSCNTGCNAGMCKKANSTPGGGGGGSESGSGGNGDSGGGWDGGSGGNGDSGGGSDGGSADGGGSGPGNNGSGDGDGGTSGGEGDAGIRTILPPSIERVGDFR